MERETQIRSSDVQDILTKVPNRLLVWSNAVILLLILVFLFSTWFIKYPDVISCEVKITSINPIYSATANQTGRLDSILVSNNHEVEYGQVLGILQNNASFQDVMDLKWLIDTFSIESNNGVEVLQDYSNRSLGQLSASFALFENEYLDFQLRNSLNYYSYFNNHQLSISSLEKRLLLLEEQKSIENQRLILARKDFDRHEKLFEAGAIAEKEYEMQEMDLRNREKNMRTFDLSIEEVKQSLNESKKASQEAEILKKLEQSKSFKTVMNALMGLKEAIKNWEDQYLIKSEIDGIVSMMGGLKLNQVVKKGSPICNVIPTHSGGFVAQLKAPSTNSGKIGAGQQVNISLSNYPVAEYGYISGVISSISRLPTKEGFYWVEVVLPEELQTTYGFEIQHQFEMTGSAEIITEDLRLFERFFYRLRGIIS